MRKFEDFLSKAKETYHEALKLLARGDFLDAAEKSWWAVELMRKALLVSVRIPPEKAESLEFSLPIFERLLKAIERRDLLREYYRFNSCLHVMGFYRMLTSEEEIAKTLEEVDTWIRNIENIAKKLSGVNLSKVVELMDEALRIKREILKANVKYHEALSKISELIRQTTSK